MPIVESVDATAPLSQGDILRGVSLFVIDKWWKDGAAKSSKNVAACLVISRPCILQNQREFVVAEILQTQSGIPNDIQKFSECRRFLSDLRDGAKQRDTFYLGHLPACGSGRYVAKLSRLHTLSLPEEKAELLEWIKVNRAGRVADDFIRALHVRLFGSFAELGFDDDRWYSDEDLKLIVSRGRAERMMHEAEMHRAEAEGKPTGDIVKQLSSLNGSLAPLEAELQGRATPPAPPAKENPPKSL